MTRFLFRYGPGAQISCCACHKGTRMVAAPNSEVTDQDVAYYTRIHVCGPPREPWDLEHEGRAS